MTKENNTNAIAPLSSGEGRGGEVITSDTVTMPAEGQSTDTSSWGNKVRMGTLALMTALAPSATTTTITLGGTGLVATMASCGDKDKDPEPVSKDHPRADVLGEIKPLTNSTHAGIKVTGYETLSGNGVVPTALAIDFTTDNAQNRAMINAWVKAFRDYLPNHFNENSTLADVDAYFASHPEAGIYQHIYVIGFSGTKRVDVIDEKSHSLSKYTKQNFDIKSLIIDNPACKDFFENKLYTKNGEQLLNKELIDDAVIKISLMFYDPSVGGTILFSSNISQTPMYLVSYNR